jgi:hypothetical protein
MVHMVLGSDAMHTGIEYLDLAHEYIACILLVLQLQL